LDAPRAPLILALKVVFGKLLPVQKLCKKKFSTMCIYDDGNSVFRALFLMQNFRIWGLMGQGVKFVVESAIFGIADPDLPIHFATFMGVRLRVA